MMKLFLLAYSVCALAGNLKAEVVNWHGLWVSSEDLAKFSPEEIARADRAVDGQKTVAVLTDPTPFPSPSVNVATQEQGTNAPAAATGVEVLFLCLVFFGIIFYFLPTMINSHRNGASSRAIFAVNLFFGWTLLGWLAALIWACTDTPRLNDLRPKLPRA